MECIEIKFPDGQTKQFKKGNPIVMLGANGSGKTRLSVKIEELNDQNFRHQYDPNSFLVQRISAQKSLSISESIIIKGLDASEREAIIGTDNPQSSKQGNRYGSNPATHLLNDYNKIISLFFAKNNKLIEDYHLECRKAQAQNQSQPIPPESIKEKAEKIWAYLLPNRQIDLSGNEVHVKATGKRYHGKEMSDGERVVLYMIMQVLSVKTDSLLIIDEPELHIHKAILNKLWDKLEEARQDCVFMYITHNLEFAVSRNVEEVLWVKSFDGTNNWEYEFLPLTEYSALPEGLLFELIGTHKKIIFVEGTKDSLDYLIYQEVYKDSDYHVIPCGGCSQVINYVKAKNGYNKFAHISVFGIVDRDYRPGNEIESLKTDNIFTLEVAEVENLFIVPELLSFVSQRIGCDVSAVNDAKSLVLQIFNGVKSKQIMAAFASEINHQLNILNFDGSNTTDDVKTIIDTKFSKVNIDTIFTEKSNLFNGVTKYEEVLKVFNYKELSDKISGKFGLQNGKYRKMIIDLLKRSGDQETKESIINAITPYIPSLPQ